MGPSGKFGLASAYNYLVLRVCIAYSSTIREYAGYIHIYSSGSSCSHYYFIKNIILLIDA
ncbi:hypothetical protein D3C81_1554460 [compost metagenome]